MHLLDAWDNYHRHGDRSAVSRPCEAAESTGLGYEADRFSDGKGGVRESDESRPPSPSAADGWLAQKISQIYRGVGPDPRRRSRPDKTHCREEDDARYD